MHGNVAPYLLHDGIYFEIANGIASANIVKGTEAGGVVSTEKALQSQWNIDRLTDLVPLGKWPTGPRSRSSSWTSSGWASVACVSGSKWTLDTGLRP